MEGRSVTDGPPLCDLGQPALWTPAPSSVRGQETGLLCPSWED